MTWGIIFSLNSLVHTLKWYSSPTRKGNEMAWRIRFSFRVCSTCFSLTTCLRKTQSTRDSVTGTQHKQYYCRTFSGRSIAPSVCLGSSWRRRPRSACAWPTWPCQKSLCPEFSAGRSHPTQLCSERWEKQIISLVRRWTIWSNIGRDVKDTLCFAWFGCFGPLFYV